ncbi:hypothetical protein Goarm_023182, partial [Gossypium armourianum]|nr:hypothetical protein [Gossypium armourianum]
KIQLEKGDSLTKGYTSELWDFTCISVTQNNLQEFKEIWAQWDDEFWNSAYSCFTFGKVDMVPTVEEYTALLRCPRVQVDKVYSRAANVLTFAKKLMKITGISEQWILAHPDTKKKVDVFSLSIYGMVIFPKALGHINEVVTDLFDQLDKRVTPVPAILAETFRSLSVCRKAGEGRFIGCVQLLLAWFHSHFWKVDKGLAQCEFSYKDDNYKRKIREMSSVWRQIHRMKRFTVEAMATPEYYEWWSKRVNDNIPEPGHENSQMIEEHLLVVLSELEIIKQDFERRNTELEKKIEQMEE